MHVKPVYGTWVGALTKGTIYTVSGTHPPLLAGLWSISLAEISNADLYGPFWHIDQFRPLISQADDLKAHFHALLHVRNPQLEAAE